MTSRFVGEDPIFPATFAPRGCGTVLRRGAGDLPTRPASRCSDHVQRQRDQHLRAAELQGRAPIHEGQGPGLTRRLVGEPVEARRDERHNGCRARPRARCAWRGLGDVNTPSAAVMARSQGTLMSGTPVADPVQIAASAVGPAEAASRINLSLVHARLLHRAGRHLPSAVVSPPRSPRRRHGSTAVFEFGRVTPTARGQSSASRSARSSARAAAAKPVAVGGLLYNADGTGRSTSSATNGRLGSSDEPRARRSPSAPRGRQGRAPRRDCRLQGPQLGLTLGSNKHAWLTT